MRWLFAVFLASLCALLWAALSVARHIRKDAHAEVSNDPQQPVADADTPANTERDTR